MTDTVTIQIISFQMAALVTILGFLWKLHHEVINLHKDNATCASAWLGWKVSAGGFCR